MSVGGRSPFWSDPRARSVIAPISFAGNVTRPSARSTVYPACVISSSMRSCSTPIPTSSRNRTLASWINATSSSPRTRVHPDILICSSPCCPLHCFPVLWRSTLASGTVYIRNRGARCKHGGAPAMRKHMGRLCAEFSPQSSRLLPSHPRRPQQGPGRQSPILNSSILNASRSLPFCLLHWRFCILHFPAVRLPSSPRPPVPPPPS